MPYSFVKVAIGDEVAILPSTDATPAEVIEIATVARINRVYIELEDGRCYATIGGHCLLNGTNKTLSCRPLMPTSERWHPESN
jgi:hypothetical protein